MIVNIILTGEVGSHEPTFYETSQYRPCETNDMWILVDMNDLIYQVQIGQRHFVVLAHHWDKFKASGYQKLDATELKF